LTNDPIRYGALRDGLCKINYSFAKPRRSFFQVVHGLCVRLLSNKRRFVIIPKRIVILLRILGFRHSLVIHHSSLEFRHSGARYREPGGALKRTENSY
jgi:hypothetical protein